MNAPRLWNLNKEHLAGVRIFWPAFGNCVHNCQILNKEALLNFKGLLQDGGRADFAVNFCASPFNKDLSHDTTFSQIHLDGQYL